MKRLTFYLTVFGILCMGAAVTGVASVSTGAGSTSIGHHPSLLSRGIAFVYGVVLLWLAYGIRYRLRAAWSIGMLGVAVSWVLLAVEVFFTIAEETQEQSLGDKIGITALIMGLSSLVFFHWGRRWYMQRDYFSEPHAK